MYSCSVSSVPFEVRMSQFHKTRTALVCEELYFWHDSGCISGGNPNVQPLEGWEHPETKRRFYNLLSLSGLIDNTDTLAKDTLARIKARSATREEILQFHTPRYHDFIVTESENVKGGEAGEMAKFGCGGYKIAALSAGGVLKAVEAVLDTDTSNTIKNAYCLVRPPGHHAIADMGMGFCIFNNIALAALHAKKLGLTRIAIVDFDVHHGNGTQEAFYKDQNILFISIHQDNNYPQGNSGAIEQTGEDQGKDFTINVPLPPGCGHGAYEYAFKKIVIPALHRHQPELLLISCGYDACYCDPLGAMTLHSDSYRMMATQLVAAAEDLCHGRIVFAHEGGYSKDYVPFCGLAVIEAMSGIKSTVEDPYVNEAKAWGYQSLQPHQEALIDKIGALHNF